MGNTIMTIAIIVGVLLLVFLALHFKQKKEAEMNADFDAMAERGDLEGISHFYKKQLYWWVPLTVVMLILFGTVILEGRPADRLMISFVAVAIPAYRVFQLAKNWLEAEKMRKEAHEQACNAAEAENPEVLLKGIRDFLGDECEATPLEVSVGKHELTQAYLTAKAEGEQCGFFPVILQLNSTLIENLYDERTSASAESPLEGAQVMQQKMQDLKDMFDDEAEWNDFLGDEANAEGSQSMDLDTSADFDWGRFVLAKVPVARASEIFAKIPMGNWNDCPTAAEHQAIAQYWNEKYGAVPCFISSDVIMYQVPKPVDTQSAYDLALEQTAYAPDIVMQGYDTVWSLAKQLEQASFWYFWWD